MYWLVPINFKVSGVTNAGLLCASTETCCRVPVLLVLMLPATGLAMANDLGVENALLMSLAAALKGFSMKWSPAAGAVLVVVVAGGAVMTRPSRAGRSLRFVVGFWNKNVPLLPAVPGVKLNVVKTPSDWRLTVPEVALENVNS